MKTYVARCAWRSTSSGHPLRRPTETLLTPVTINGVNAKSSGMDLSVLVVDAAQAVATMLVGMLKRRGVAAAHESGGEAPWA